MPVYYPRSQRRVVAKEVLFLGPPGVGTTPHSIFDLLRDFMKDEAFNQQERRCAIRLFQKVIVKKNKHKIAKTMQIYLPFIIET